MKLLEARRLGVSYGALNVLADVSFTLDEGQWLMVVGPNGAGKSTLVGAVSQYLRYTGQVLYLGRDVKTYKPRALARCLGVLSQAHSVGYAFTVGEVVRLGRYAYAPGVFSSRPGEDEEACRQALELTGLTALERHSVLTLSGGELQRTFLAQVLAQDPKLLVLDEPTNHLDLAYQKDLFTLIGAWRREPGRAVISVVHDLSLARAYGTHALLLDHGRTAALGELGQVFGPETLNRAYGMDVAAWMRQMLAQWEP